MVHPDVLKYNYTIWFISSNINDVLDEINHIV
jgi:hypothetical protein